MNLQPNQPSNRLQHEGEMMDSWEKVVKGNFYHWTKDPIPELQSRKYIQSQRLKPEGFWFDHRGDWRRWCTSENFRIDYFKYRHRVMILEGANVLFLSDAGMLDQFTEEFKAQPFPVRGGSLYIDWPRVAKLYGGVVIAPYCWERRMELDWYYVWDCASGCVWDTDAIKLGPAKPLITNKKESNDGSPI